MLFRNDLDKVHASGVRVEARLKSQPYHRSVGYGQPIGRLVYDAVLVPHDVPY